MRRTLLTALAVAAAVIVPASAAMADQTATSSTSLTLTGGSLTFSTVPAVGNFPSTALTGSAQTVTAAASNWGVNDATGTGSGWHVTVAASQFSDGGSHTLPTGTLKLAEPSAVAPADVNNTSPAPTIGTNSNSAIDSGSAVQTVSAASGAGEGVWNFTQNAHDLSVLVARLAAPHWKDVRDEVAHAYLRTLALHRRHRHARVRCIHREYRLRPRRARSLT
jgi:hypothetical protein